MLEDIKNELPKLAAHKENIDANTIALIDIAYSAAMADIMKFLNNSKNTEKISTAKTINGKHVYYKAVSVKKLKEHMETSLKLKNKIMTN